MYADEADDSDWEEDWPDDSEDFTTIACPNCGAEIYEDTPRCPVCGDYVVASSSRVWDGKPMWYFIVGLLGIVAVVWAMLRI